jgi:hypothetical protein
MKMFIRGGNLEWMSSEPTIKEYVETHFQIEAEIEKLQNAMAAHNEQAVNINQEHVDDVKRILGQLKQKRQNNRKPKSITKKALNSVPFFSL